MSHRESGDILVIAHDWPTACWYPQLTRLLIRKPILLPKGKYVLTLPHSGTSKPHPLQHKLQLLALQLSGNPLKQKAFMETLVPSCVQLGGRTINSTRRTREGGKGFVLKGIFIPFSPLSQMSYTF